MTAMKKLCPFNDRRSCPGCKYEISTKATMHLMVKEYQRLFALYKSTTNGALKEKYKTLAKEIVLPSMDEMLQCMGEQYGDESVEELEKIIREMRNAK
jgi:hypothetical protein